MIRAALMCAIASSASMMPDVVVAQDRNLPLAGGASPALMSAPLVQPASLGVNNDRAIPLSEADLAGNRGGQTLVVGNQTLTSVTKGNVLNGNYVAGSVTLSDKALSNFNGVGNIVINTGAQVSLQSGMNLTINVAQ